MGTQRVLESAGREEGRVFLGRQAGWPLEPGGRARGWLLGVPWTGPGSRGTFRAVVSRTFFLIHFGVCVYCTSVPGVSASGQARAGPWGWRARWPGSSPAACERRAPTTLGRARGLHACRSRLQARGDHVGSHVNTVSSALGAVCSLRTRSRCVGGSSELFLSC